jgi:hypothetical protein
MKQKPTETSLLTNGLHLIRRLQPKVQERTDDFTSSTTHGATSVKETVFRVFVELARDVGALSNSSLAVCIAVQLAQVRPRHSLLACAVAATATA